MIKCRSQKSEARITKCLPIVFLIALMGLIMARNASANLTIKANHDHIKIDFFYHGSTVGVSGEADQGTDLIVKIASDEGHQALRKKGKVAGILWMNVGELKFEHVPNIYLLQSTKKLEEILSPEEMDKYVLGYPSLERHLEIAPVENGNDKDRWFNEFVRYKESSKMYGISSGRISTNQNSNSQSYYVKMDWPYKAPPGSYTVSVYAVKGNKIVEKAETNVFVEQVGGVKRLFDMAKTNGALYGIISIAVALGAGFGVGMIFRKGGGAH